MNSEELEVGDCFDLANGEAKGSAAAGYYMVLDKYYVTQRNDGRIIVMFDCMSTRGKIITLLEDEIVKEILYTTFIRCETAWHERGRAQVKDKRKRRRSNRSNRGKRNVAKELEAAAL